MNHKSYQGIEDRAGCGSADPDACKKDEGVFKEGRILNDADGRYYPEKRAEVSR
jgi:hypothetical protein